MNRGESALEALDFVGCGIAFASAEDVRAAVVKHLESWWRWGVELLPRAPALPLHLPKEYAPLSTLVTLYEVAGCGAVLIESNLRDIYLSLLSMVSKAVPDAIFVAVRSLPVGKGENPIEDFGIFRNGTRDYLRHVWVARDGDRWRFGESGEPQPYEQVGDYTQRLLRRRLTRAHIVRYLAAMGVPMEAIAKGEGVRHIASFRERVKPAED